MINIAVLGYGTVGSGVVEVFRNNRAVIAKRVGQEVNVKYILDRIDFPDAPDQEKFVKDFDVILKDDSVSVVVEVMGGIHPACDFVKASLEAGKSVVSSNKEMVAEKAPGLLQAARDNNVNFLFDASVGGGIPIMKPLYSCLAANEISEVAGILNGTTNFILTKMIAEGVSFADALAEAQQLGYAEADPEADVEGHDACRKICILSSLVSGSHVYPDQVKAEGITEISLDDVAYAASAGMVIKLIARARFLEGGKVHAAVSPALVPDSSMLAGVVDAFNGILVSGNAVDDVLFYGRGAGKLPTASAVVADIIDCIRADGTIKEFFWSDSGRDNVVDGGSLPARYYVRCKGDAGAASSLVGHQFLRRDGQPGDEFAFLTGTGAQSALEGQLDTLRQKGVEILAALHVLEK